MRIAALILAVPLLVVANGCGDDDDEDHEHHFTDYAECYEHEESEGAGPEAIMTECDEFFAVEHATAAACTAYYEDAVAAGVPQASVDAHCGALFPPEEG